MNRSRNDSPRGQESPSDDRREQTIIFDFDGTVCLGDGPVIAFAQALDRRAPGHGLADAVRAFLTSPSLIGPLAGCDDPYDVVALAAGQAGIPRALSDAAYAESREGVWRSDVATPEGFIAFVRSLHVRPILVTNAPAVGFDALLDRLSLGGLFATVVTDADKPRGMHDLLSRYVPEGRVLSVGDKWINDLAPASFLGVDTALVDTFDRRADAGRATFRARTLPELYDDIREWSGGSIPALSATTSSERGQTDASY